MKTWLSILWERLTRGQLRGPKEDPNAVAAGSSKDNPPEPPQPDNPVDSRL